MSIHSFLLGENLLADGCARGFTGSRETRESPPERLRRAPPARPAMPRRTRPSWARLARLPLCSATGARRATNLVPARRRCSLAAAPAAKAFSFCLHPVHSWSDSLFFQVFFERAQRAEDAQFNGRNRNL